MEGLEFVQVCLSPPADDDPHLSKKTKLLTARNLRLELKWRQDLPRDELLGGLDRLVQCARILLLDELEVYFVEDDDIGPFSPRNEIESLNSVLSAINLSLDSYAGVAADALQFLKETILDLIAKMGTPDSVYEVSDVSNSTAEKLLINWGEEQGMKSHLRICHFEGAGRGAVASRDLDVGDTALEIPSSLIICEDHVRGSEMFDVLKNLDGISPETMVLLWSMKERHNPNSRFRLYFEALPDEFRTGLSFGIEALVCLEGTALFEELVQAKEHLRQQYDTLCPKLCADYPNIFEPELYSWGQFLWACELWYSNSMKIRFPDGKLQTCLVPIAGFLNHSICPHVTRYGRVDPSTKSLRLVLSRPCNEGEQCFLSYGSFPSSHLITFYGFIPRDLYQNPYDVVPLDFEDSTESTHMVRGTWLSKSNGPPNYSLPPPLLTYLRSTLDSEVNGETERAVFEAVQSIFRPIMEQIGADSLDRDGASWDFKLALDFVDFQRKIISSVLTSSSVALQSLGCTP